MAEKRSYIGLSAQFKEAKEPMICAVKCYPI
jgi:hypothetical protein